MPCKRPCTCLSLCKCNRPDVLWNHWFLFFNMYLDRLLEWEIASVCVVKGRKRNLEISHLLARDYRLNEVFRGGGGRFLDE